MTLSRKGERGEGKIGCIIMLLVLVAAAAAAAKIVPVLYSNSSLSSYAEEVATKGGLYKEPALQQMLQDKAKELDIPEALAAGAMNLTTTGPGTGVCTIRLHYTRSVDLYGVYSLDLSTDKTISSKYMDAR